MRVQRLPSGVVGLRKLWSSAPGSVLPYHPHLFVPATHLALCFMLTQHPYLFEVEVCAVFFVKVLVLGYSLQEKAGRIRTQAQLSVMHVSLLTCNCICIVSTNWTHAPCVAHKHDVLLLLNPYSPVVLSLQCICHACGYTRSHLMPAHRHKQAYNQDWERIGWQMEHYFAKPYLTQQELC